MAHAIPGSASGDSSESPLFFALVSSAIPQVGLPRPTTGRCFYNGHEYRALQRASKKFEKFFREQSGKTEVCAGSLVDFMQVLDP